ncbi:piezo-type mechanosensitive ion channel component 2 [Asbolus verrucosus]|uniref:Piezo-type mechanosensitive ion channel component 2 n=1 Tax=Asbolus verrucosus TaxID=1661398 RepID=A0A482VYV8_ASBVE|nr:piezo-type mechanosensitive ion channel component 2 [Asbolus verrucosus]
MAGRTGIYLKFMIAMSFLTAITQLSFQIVLLSMPPYAHFLERSKNLEKILRQVGLVRLDKLDAVSVITWISPEIVMLITSIGTYIICHKLLQKGPIEEAENEENLPRKAKTGKKKVALLVAIGKYAVLIALCVAAVLRPSIQGGLYFLVFLSSATWWACYKQLRKGFAIMMRCLSVISQKKQGPFSRLEGSFTQPMSRQLSQRLSANKHLMRSATTRNKWKNATRKVRLIRGVSPSRRYGSGTRKAPSVLQDSVGSVTVTGDNPDDIPMSPLGKGATEEDYNPTVLENIMFALESLLQLIIKSSYVVTNIIMMAWSITYLSWITFVLLLWANLLWLVPNQRKSMLRSSPFLVIYAWFLLISAYIYSMDLNENELPSTIEGIDMNELGFQRETDLPCNPLLVKCLFTAMFWITLRQYMQERLAEKQNNALADMVAPLQVTVGTAAGVNNEQEQGSKLMDKIGKYLRKLLTKFWIWVVAITLFAVAITGERMTGFRVIYMALFLVFILSFQISFRGWRKMMFGFWLTVIVYSMIILVMVYTYQFKNFKNYWSDYLHVPEKQQMDIGLEKFDKTQLFVRLLTPTFFVIITVIQLHYFHKDFMEMSDPKNASIIGVELDQSSLQGGAAAANSDKDETITSSLKYDLTETDTPKTKWQLWQRRFHYGMDICYLFLELHMPKFVLLFLMLACVYDKCALYLILIILIVLACTIGRPMQIFAIYCSSFFVSLMLLARMIYQIEYIDEAKWNVTCDIANKTEVQNNTKWLGFYKVHKDTTLPHLVKWNIIYILVVTLWAVVLVRQFNYRVSRGKPTVRAFFMFPKITRNDADKNLSNCIKYLFNYGFYKFGVEICLMATVALIGFRMDMYSVIYSIWLCILFNLKRKTLAKVWNCYMIFIALLLPLQYVMTVGLPPTLCIEFWNEGEEQKAELFRRLQDWAYLLDTQIPPSPKKLICDFILLLLVSRQSVVFRIEKRYAGQEYNGGSNDSIIHYAEEKGFVNPVPDFISTVRSYLDVFKKAVFSSFLWITLAIVFLAGTNRVNLFSIGYLVGAFIFLWQGTDLYLRPIPKILKSWNLFLGYNVTVILIKTALQIVGCIFIKEIPNSSCWLIQLFGIGCVRKFGDLSLQAGHEDAQNCKVPREFVGLVWDGLCFGFMITQRRLFQSYNFFHLIDEIKAGTILASRGAELIEELRLKRMTEQDEQERRVLEKIKAKMDKIKANQQKIQGASYKDSENHYTDQPPLAHSSSMSSCASATSQQTSPAGYHTPIDDEEHAPLTPRSSLLQQQAPSPYSAVMTVSLEGYLEPQRMSFSSPPNSELNPRPPSPDDSFPVFSPPPYDAAPPYAEAVSEPPAAVQRQTSIGPPWMQGSFVTPRQSVISYSSRSPLSHHEYTIFKGRPKRRRREPKSYKQAVRSGDYYMFDDLDDDEELDFMEEPKPDEDDEYRGQTVGQLLSTAMKTDIGTTVRQHSLIEVKRRASMPLARQKSVVSARSQISAPYSAPPIIDEHVQRSVKIIDDRRKSDEPQPSTSKDDDVSESGEKDYRYVLRVLAKEKKILKENTDYSVGLRLGSGQVWQPATSYNSLLRQSREESVIPTPSAGTFSPSDSYRLALVEDRMASEREDKGDVKSSISEDSDTKALATTLPYTSEQDSPESSHLDMEEYDVTEMSSYDQPPIIRLLLAIWHIIMSRSENVCYFIVFLNQIKSATFLSLPLPLMVFLWGTLTIPRPNKNFWVTIIAYTEVIVLIKCMFQFDIIPWNMSQAVTNNPFYPPRIIGIERNKYYAVWDLLLLLVVFFHRFMLKSMGLWKTSPTPAALLEEGTYKVTSEGKLEPLDDVSSKVRKRGSPASRASDLQRLVEESEDPDEDKKDGSIMSTVDSEMENKVVLVQSEVVEPMSHLPQSVKMAGFNSVIAPQMYYMVKCFYLLLSAYQIRCGYPTRILGNFLCKGYNYVNMFLFKAFMAVPFLFELRTVMDWMWTDTSMTVFDWIKMEDIFAHIFQLKCTRHVEDEYPQPRGERKTPVIKYLMGGAILALIIAIIWFPLVFFSLGNAVGEPNPPYDVTLELRIGPYEPVYQMSAQSNSIFQFTESNLVQLQQLYAGEKNAATFISNYEALDIAAVKLSSDSANIWSISPPDRKRMVIEVNSTDPLSIRLEYKVSHKTSKPEDSGVIPDNVEIQIPALINGKANPMRQNLLKMLEGDTNQTMLLKDILPKFLKVTNRGTAKPVSQLMVAEDKDSDAGKSFRTISLSLGSSTVDGTKEWWKIQEACNDTNYEKFLSHIPYKDCDSIILYTFNDKIFPSTLNILTGGGIVGLYTTLVFVASRFLRGFFADQCFKIMFEDMPYIDRVLQLCLDIYLVREAREFALEEDLFAKLVFLFRSPETMIKWTRPKEELADDEDPEGDA